MAQRSWVHPIVLSCRYAQKPAACRACPAENVLRLTRMALAPSAFRACPIARNPESMLASSISIASFLACNRDTDWEIASIGMADSSGLESAKSSRRRLPVS